MEYAILKDLYICDFNQYKKVMIKINTQTKTIIEIKKTININKDDKVISLNDYVIMPSFIDLNTKLKNETCKTAEIKLLSKNAKQSGIDKFLISLKSKLYNENIVENIYNSHDNAYICIEAINENKLNEISILKNKGAKALYINIISNEHLLLKVFEYAKMFNMPIFCSFFDANKEQGDMINSYTSDYLGLDGIDDIKEYANVAKILEYAKELEVKVVFNSLINTKSLELIQNSTYKNIYAEVSIHHLLLDEISCNDFNTLAKIMPPLASKKMRKQLLINLEKNNIHLLTSLESEISKANKNLSFSEAKFGISSILDYFALVYTFLVKEDIISLSKASELMSYNQSLIINEEEKSIYENISYSNMLLIDLEHKYQVDNKKSPYYGKTLYSKIHHLDEFIKENL